jgi:hypothetical protein
MSLSGACCGKRAIEVAVIVTAGLDDSVQALWMLERQRLGPIRIC